MFTYICDAASFLYFGSKWGRRDESVKQGGQSEEMEECGMMGDGKVDADMTVFGERAEGKEDNETERV